MASWCPNCRSWWGGTDSHSPLAYRLMPSMDRRRLMVAPLQNLYLLLVMSWLETGLMVTCWVAFKLTSSFVFQSSWWMLLTHNAWLCPVPSIPVSICGAISHRLSIVNPVGAQVGQTGFRVPMYCFINQDMVWPLGVISSLSCAHVLTHEPTQLDCLVQWCYTLVGIFHDKDSSVVF